MIFESISLYLTIGALIIAVGERSNPWETIGLDKPYEKFFARAIVIFLWLPIMATNAIRYISTGKTPYDR